MTQLPDTNSLIQLEALIRADSAEAARRLWRIGTALLEVRRDELWRHRDCGSFNDWLQGYSVLSRPTAYRAMQVAEQFSGSGSPTCQAVEPNRPAPRPGTANCAILLSFRDICTGQQACDSLPCRSSRAGGRTFGGYGGGHGWGWS